VSGAGGVNRKYVDNVFAGGTIDYDGNFGITTTGKRSEVLAFSMATDVTTAGGVAVNKGGIDLNSNKILRVKTPTISTDGASKGYVDQALATGGVRTGWNGFTLNNTTTRYTVTSVNLTITGSGYTTASYNGGPINPYYQYALLEFIPNTIPTKNPNRAFIDLSRFKEKTQDVGDPYTYFYVQEDSIPVKKYVVYDIDNLESESNYSGTIKIYDLKEGINTLSNNLEHNL
jgi:hypothetical protein